MMLTRFRRRLSLLSSAIIGAVLLSLTLLCLSLSEASVRRQEEESFLSNVTSLCQNLSTQPYISHTSLRQSAASGELRLWLWDSGTPLLFRDELPAQEDTSLSSLGDKIAAAARTRFFLDITAATTTRKIILHEEFPLSVGGARYLCSAALVPRGGKVLGLAIAHPLRHMQQRIRRFRLVFALADLLVLAMLSLLFSLFTQRMMRPIRENEKRQADFVACASHELKAPLAVIASQLDAARTGAIPADGHFLDTLANETGRLSRLTHDLLTLSAAQAERRSLKLQPVPLDTLLLNLWEGYTRIAAEKGLCLRVQLPEDSVPDCLCDGDQIRQLLIILLDNALAYTPAGGYVTLTLEAETPDHRSVRAGARRTGFTLCVADTGPGIPDAQKETVFLRFFRGDPAHADRAHFGLGLSIAEQIVRAHRGSITVCDAPGGGTLMRVRLP